MPLRHSTATTLLLAPLQGPCLLRLPTITAAVPRDVTQSLRRPNPSSRRPFSTTPSLAEAWLEPHLDRRNKRQKGRPRVPTGGSHRGTTVVWGDWGLRMVDKQRRISAKQLRLASTTIKNRLRGERFKLFPRVCCNVGVFVSGNEVCEKIDGGIRITDLNATILHHSSLIFFKNFFQLRMRY